MNGVEVQKVDNKLLVNAIMERLDEDGKFSSARKKRVKLTARQKKRAPKLQPRVIYCRGLSDSDNDYSSRKQPPKRRGQGKGMERAKRRKNGSSSSDSEDDSQTPSQAAPSAPPREQQGGSSSRVVHGQNTRTGKSRTPPTLQNQPVSDPRNDSQTPSQAAPSAPPPEQQGDSRKKKSLTAECATSDDGTPSSTKRGSFQQRGDITPEGSHTPPSEDISIGTRIANDENFHKISRTLPRTPLSDSRGAENEAGPVQPATPKAPANGQLASSRVPFARRKPSTADESIRHSPYPNVGEPRRTQDMANRRTSLLAEMRLEDHSYEEDSPLRPSKTRRVVGVMSPEKQTDEVEAGSSKRL